MKVDGKGDTWGSLFPYAGEARKDGGTASVRGFVTGLSTSLDAVTPVGRESKSASAILCSVRAGKGQEFQTRRETEQAPVALLA